MRAFVIYEGDTRVCTSGNEIRYHRIYVHGDAEVKEALHRLRKDKEQWSVPLARLIEIGEKAVLEGEKDGH